MPTVSQSPLVPAGDQLRQSIQARRSLECYAITEFIQVAALITTPHELKAQTADVALQTAADQIGLAQLAGRPAASPRQVYNNCSSV